MEQPVNPVPSMESGEESPSQKQARIRRERREAKIKAGGSARLDKITQLSGRPPPEPGMLLEPLCGASFVDRGTPLM